MTTIGRILLVGAALAVAPATAAFAESYPPSLPTTTTTTTPSNPTTTTTTPKAPTTTLPGASTTLPGASTTAPSELPKTGSDVAPLVQAGIALVAVGGGIAVVATRRRKSAS